MDLFYDILKCFFGYRKENREYRYNSGINYKNSPNGINMLNSPKEVSIHVRIENLENNVADSINSISRKINTSNQKLSRKINIIENDNQKLKDGIENVLRDIGNNFNELDAENKALKEKIKALEKYNSRLRSDIQSINQRYIDLNDKVSRYLNASSLGIWDKIE